MSDTGKNGTTACAVPDRSWVRRGAIALLSALSLAGCYRYVPVELSQLSPGTPMRAQLTGAAMDRMRGSDQAALVRRAVVSGRLTRTTQDSMVVGVESTLLEANVRSRTFYSDLALLKSDVRQYELRRLDKRRTTLTAIGFGVGAVAAVLIAVEYGGRSTGTVQPGPGVPEQRIPLGITLRFP